MAGHEPKKCNVSATRDNKENSMPMFLGTDDQGTSQFTLQDFEPSFGSKMSAAIRESWLESYGPTAVDFWK